ncbi:Diadenosine tetraphosphate (Ap4A) hydrolase and other HIT family hydrolases [Phocaeicola vulgatus]|nr:Diadenosine tetraphosphate (Ap4A) hydrolase and other HIT family hydrolases [Phocaeicola vulgatus]
MKSDPKDCLYCQNNETLHNLMIEIAPLSVSRVFLLRNKPIADVALLLIKIM